MGRWQRCDGVTVTRGTWRTKLERCLKEPDAGHFYIVPDGSTLEPSVPAGQDSATSAIVKVALCGGCKDRLASSLYGSDGERISSRPQGGGA